MAASAVPPKKKHTSPTHSRRRRVALRKVVPPPSDTEVPLSGSFSVSLLPPPPAPSFAVCGVVPCVRVFCRVLWFFARGVASGRAVLVVWCCAVPWWPALCLSCGVGLLFFPPLPCRPLPLVLCVVLSLVVLCCVLLRVASGVVPWCAWPACLHRIVWCFVSVCVLCGVLFPLVLCGAQLRCAVRVLLSLPRPPLRVLPLVLCVVLCPLVLLCGVCGVACLLPAGCRAAVPRPFRVVLSLLALLCAVLSSLVSCLALLWCALLRCAVVVCGAPPPPPRCCSWYCAVSCVLLCCGLACFAVCVLLCCAVLLCVLFGFSVPRRVVLSCWCSVSLLCVDVCCTVFFRAVSRRVAVRCVVWCGAVPCGVVLFAVCGCAAPPPPPRRLLSAVLCGVLHLVVL